MNRKFAWIWGLIGLAVGMSGAICYCVRAAFGGGGGGGF
jgi:hypothetical protein